MHTKFKRHQPVVLLRAPDHEYVEYHGWNEPIPIKKGMRGRINVILPNGQYHVEILNEEGEIIAYAPLSEDDLKADE